MRNTKAKVFVSGPIPGKALTWLEQKGVHIDVYHGGLPQSPTNEFLVQEFGKEVVELYGSETLRSEVVRGNVQAISPEELTKKLQKGYDAIIPWLTTPISEQALTTAHPKLRILSSYSAGYEHLPFECAQKQGILATHTRNVLHHAVAEHTLALILALARNIPYQDYFFRKKLFRGKWHAEFFNRGRLNDLYNCVLGIVGFGQIGKEVYTRARAFHMNICVYEPFMKPEARDAFPDVTFVDSLDHLLQQSHFVSVHVPYIPPSQKGTTHDLITLRELKLIGPKGYIINTSRGKVINEKDLVIALKKKIIAGAALDVYYNEPFAEKELYDMRLNTVLVPHTASIGSAREDGQVHDFDECVRDIDALRKGFNDGRILLGMGSLAVLNVYLALKGLEPLSLIPGTDFITTIENRRKLNKLKMIDLFIE